jgi:hypothetical protein
MLYGTLIQKFFFKVSKDSIVAIARNCPTLQVCILGGCDKLVDTAVLELAQYCPLLHTLDLTRCKVNFFHFGLVHH